MPSPLPAAQPPRTLLARMNALSSKPPMVLYLGFLLVLGVWKPVLEEFPQSLFSISGDVALFWRGILIVAIYSTLDLLIGYWREKKWILPSSAWISGLILSLVLAPTASWALTIAAPILASLGKQFIRFRRKHVFNPAALALVALGLAFPSQGVVSWWGASWGIIPFVVIVLSGIVTIFRVKRWKTAATFIVIYLVGSGALLLSRGGAVAGLQTLVLDGTLAFFATVMLIEPVTTAYQPASLRTWFGAGVAALVLLFSLPGVALPIPDPFLVSLLLGNLGATIASNVLRNR